MATKDFDRLFVLPPPQSRHIFVQAVCTKNPMAKANDGAIQHSEHDGHGHLETPHKFGDPEEIISYGLCAPLGGGSGPICNAHN